MSVTRPILYCLAGGLGPPEPPHAAASINATATRPNNRSRVCPILISSLSITWPQPGATPLGRAGLSHSPAGRPWRGWDDRRRGLRAPPSAASALGGSTPL